MTHAAIEVFGPDRVRLRRDKASPPPGATQFVARVECVGLCFSDTKLITQFDRHARKTAIIGHRLDGFPGYVPGSTPTIPGHEVVLRVTAIGRDVTSVEVDGRYVVQADFRELTTAEGNGAFGYNIEGGLQEYVLLDERVTVAADGESYLLPVPDLPAASQLALIEPWACIERAFGTRERRTLRSGGTLLHVGGGRCDGLEASGGVIHHDPAGIAPGSVDDLLYGGNDPAELERLFPLVARDGLVLIATCGRTFGRPVSVPVGRVHYGNMRIAATTSDAFADALASIPHSGELRAGDHVNVVGAGGPMGVMAMVRAIATSQPGALVEGGVRHPHRAQALADRAAPLAAAHGVDLRLFHPENDRPRGPVDYCFLMAPVPELVAGAVQDAAPGGIINVFAGIAADMPCPIDLDRYARLRLYFIGTSGSTVGDMRSVLDRIHIGGLDTNLSVGAVSGMAGALDALRAVADRTIAGKVIVYPALVEVPLLVLDAVAQRYPSIGPLLVDGCWTPAAEEALLRLGSRA
jgi:threonine dehydrogenase-like Zn-dependent dehydrogenase